MNLSKHVNKPGSATRTQYSALAYLSSVEVVLRAAFFIIAKTRLN
jgi:hypothetical protein